MVYSATITSTANKAESEKTRTTIKITKGLVYSWEIYFPPGSQGLLHVRLLDGSYCLLPSTPSESFAGDSMLFHYDDLYLKQAEPFEFFIDHWNEDEQYEHQFYVHIGMVSKDVYKARYMPTVQYEIFTKWIVELAKAQERQKVELSNWGFTGLGKGVG